MKVAFLQPAETELFAAIDYYNLQREGLGLEFAAEVRHGLERIARYPAAWTPMSPLIRRCRLQRFPYALLYHVSNDTVLIVAVQNLHQHPDVWKSRWRPGQA